MNSKEFTKKLKDAFPKFEVISKFMTDGDKEIVVTDLTFRFQLKGEVTDNLDELAETGIKLVMDELWNVVEPDIPEGN